MSDLLPLRPGDLAVGGDARRAARTISRYQSAAQVRAARVDAETDVVVAKLDALTAATATGMSRSLRVAQLQRTIEQLAPEISGRLTTLADGHLLGTAEFIDDFRRDLRRR